MVSFRIHQSEAFYRMATKKTRRNHILKQQLEKTINQLHSDPYRNSKKMAGNFRGKRRIHVGKFRILYSICEECIKLEEYQFNKCHGCQFLIDRSGHPDFDIILQTFLPRKEDYSRG